MKLREKLAFLIATLLLQCAAVSQTGAFSTNSIYFKAPLLNNVSNLEAAMKAYRSGKMSKEEITILTLATLNDQPIAFYGKLQDQFSKPLKNVPVDFFVTINNGFSSGTEKGKVLTDANGAFKVSGFHGASLGLMPHLDGYAPLSANTFFNYSHLEENYFAPDPQKPIVVSVWKIQGAEPLVNFDKTYKLPYTNAPIRFDFVSGTIVSNGGDLLITISRPAGPISRNDRQWSRVKFDAADGGLMRSSNERTTYFAPEIGYQPSETISATDRIPEGGTEGFHTGFFVKSRGGQVFTKLGFTLGITGQTDILMTIRCKGVANTNFSRNWEGAPNTYLNPRF